MLARRTWLNSRYHCMNTYDRKHSSMSFRHTVTYLQTPSRCAVRWGHSHLVFHGNSPWMTCYYLTLSVGVWKGWAVAVLFRCFGVTPHHNKPKGFSQDRTQHPTICRDSAQTSKCTLWLKPQPPPAIFRRKNSQNYASLDIDLWWGLSFPGRLTEGIQLEHICVTHASCFGSTFQRIIWSNIWEMYVCSMIQFPFIMFKPTRNWPNPRLKSGSLKKVEKYK